MWIKEFIKVMKKQKASYVNYLEELMNNEIISKEEFISNIYNVNDFLLELVKDGRIKKNEYDEKLPVYEKQDENTAHKIS